MVRHRPAYILLQNKLTFITTNTDRFSTRRVVINTEKNKVVAAMIRVRVYTKRRASEIEQACDCIRGHVRLLVVYQVFRLK